MSGNKPKIAILGAGPIGLEAALAAAEKGFPFTLYEAGPRVASQMWDWGHVRLFTPWDLDVSPRMRSALADAGHEPPDGEVCPTGAELITRVLQPVAELPQVRAHLRYGARVRQIGREGLLKHEEIGTQERARRPFRLLVAEGGRESLEPAEVLLDCTGTPKPNPFGDGGIPALGEETLDGFVARSIPDLERESAAWAGKTILLIGAGHSAQTAIQGLAELAESVDDTRVLWAVRSLSPTWGAVADDPLPARAALTSAAAALAGDPPPSLEVLRGVVVESVVRQEDGRLGITLRRRDGSRETVSVDRILSLTGQVGDHLLYRQLQVHECYATCGPMKLAATLMASQGGDCMQQTSHGPETLKNPEPRFFILGSKSYGRRTDFLMRVGWQQVDEVFQLLQA